MKGVCVCVWVCVCMKCCENAEDTRINFPREVGRGTGRVLRQRWSNVYGRWAFGGGGKPEKGW